jgi:hypothetical protein
LFILQAYILILNIAIVVYSSGIHPYIKWPIVVFSFLAGIAFAFFPLQDRPLSKWVFLFIKAIYSPTVFVWKKIEPKPQIFQPESSQKTPTSQQTPTIPPATPIQQAMAVQPVAEGSEKLEKTEKEFLTKVSAHFKSPPPPPNQRAHTLQELIEKRQKAIGIPKTPSVKIEAGKKTKDGFQTDPPPASSTGGQITPIAGLKASRIKAAHFSPRAAPPNPPTKANIVVGQALDTKGNIIEAAILEIKDFEGRSVRALKTNKLGHFMIVTPLQNGTFELITEKDGFSFDNLSFKAKGEIISPIAITGRKQVNESVNQ